MKSTRLLVFGAAFAISFGMAFGGSATANEIYKWVDDEGNVHYGDRPTSNDQAEVVALTYQRADSSSASRRGSAQGDAAATLQEKRAARAEAKKTAAEAAAAAEEKKQRCDTYRSQLETMVQARRLYREDEGGERVYLDEDQTTAARQRVEELIAEHCSS